MVVSAVVLGARLVLRLSALPLGWLGQRPAPAAPRVAQPHARLGEPSVLPAPGDEEPTWEDAEWR